MKSNNLFVRRFMLVLTCLLAGGLFFTSCKKDEPTPDPILAVTGFAPGTGKAGDVVTITGTGFDGTTSSNNVVKFGTTTATLLAATPTTLVVQVPAGITGAQAISVANTAKATTATATTQFTVTTIITKQVVRVTNEIKADVSWAADKIYLLDGFVYVRSGTTVTIAPGTVIKGDKLSKGTLIFEPGSKINAQGTADNPIIFTSNLDPGFRNLGDWGGLVLTGKGDHNGATGVTDPTKLPVVEGGPTTNVSEVDGKRVPADNSGVLSYVRIEYAGVALSPNNEINGLSLYAVGSGTKIDHVQVSFANDDSIEWFGGAVNMKYLIAYRGIDDDFDTDNGFSGSVQFGLGVRDLTIADQSGSKGFESDNDGGSTNNQPQTSCVFSNMTLTGPTAVSNNAARTALVVLATPANPSASAPSANFVSGVHTRRNSALSMFNSVVLGWPAGVFVDGPLTAGNIAAGRSVFSNNLIGGNLTGTINGVGNASRDYIYLPSVGAGSLTPTTTLGPDSTAWAAAVGPITYFARNGNRRLRTTDEFLLTAPFAVPAPNPVPATGSPALVPSQYTNAKVSGAFFDKTPDFIGAVSTAKNFTTEKWVNFNPQAAVYQ